MKGFELENWVVSTQEYYRNLAYKSFEELSEYYYNEKEYDKLLNLSDKFFLIDNCFENACKYKVKALIATNRKQDALKQYNVLEYSLKKILDDVPSPEMQKFMAELKN
mgnify:FL=1